MKWISLKEYAAINGKKPNSALSLAWRGKFPAKTIKRYRVGERCVLIEILAGTPWPARKWAKKSKKAN